jgi:hypothetical protein
MGADEVGTLAALGSSLIARSQLATARSKLKFSDIARLTKQGSRTSLAL